MFWGALVWFCCGCTLLGVVADREGSLGSLLYAKSEPLPTPNPALRLSQSFPLSLPRIIPQGFVRGLREEGEKGAETFLILALAPSFPCAGKV
jgi:hypothetical protein